MEKFLFCLGVSKGGTTWLHSALVRNPGIGRIPRKELHYYLRQYGNVDRLTDSARLGALAMHCRRARFVSPEDELGRSVLTDPDTYGCPWDGEMARNWAQGGISSKRYGAFLQSLEWYKRFLKGPVDDNWYRSLFADVPDDRWALDFSTTNFLATRAGFRDMSAVARDTRAIIVLRDPIDRLWSHMKFHADVTRDILRFHVWSTQALRDFATHHQLVNSSLYGDAIENMKESFGEEKSLVLNFEDIRTRPAGMFEDVERFLELDPVGLPKRDDDDARIINASAKLPMPKGLFAHIAGEFERDLERVAKAGVSFVEPWIAHAQAHQKEKPVPELMGIRPLAKRAVNYLVEDRRRRQVLQTER
ncbi:sulfotransferase domain-containing protein [Poseidonocella sp. HB161398]|uniref:sulfotransferase domain-containing protein n=1 Tax=Poseidonocella sp. HB161398 TaxID=2320855 RepID=UPI001108418F|nr:sulfotransferase domain-containing protein [Poseidonocella sp. HB161398]